MAIREIPEGSIEVQPGLWAHLISFTILGEVRTRYNLYSAEGYCFYMLNVPENFDEEGNLKPAEERLYAQFAATPYTTVAQINANVVSVPAEAGYEIVSITTNEELA